LECLKERGHSEDKGVNGRKKLKWIFRKYGERVQTGFIWLKTETCNGVFEHGNKTFG
jgi:hypothetical protein